MDVRVTIATKAIAKSSDVAVVHVDSEENTELVKVEHAITAAADTAGAAKDAVIAVSDVGVVAAATAAVAAATDATVGTVSFDSDSFSVYAVVYTVDFLWEADGKAYEFSMPGGGFVSLTKLLEVLGVAEGEASGSSEGDPAEAQNAKESASTAKLTLDDVAVSAHTMEFVADVAKVEFSSPSLVDVSKVNADTTVGDIKKSRDLDVQYSAELTKEQIEEINSSAVEAGDWALISLQPFSSQETLTITMDNGDTFTVQVTDAQINSTANIVNGNYYYVYTHSNGSDYALSNTGSAAVIDASSSTLGNEYIWKFTRSSGGWIAQSVADPSVYITLDGDNVTGTTASVLSITDRTDSNQGFDIRKGDAHLALNTSANPRTNFITSTSGARIKLLDATPTENRQAIVTLHFGYFGANGAWNDLTGLTYNGENITGSTFKVTAEWAKGQGEINLEDFKKDGYTLSNTHRSTYQDLIPNVSVPNNSGANVQWPHSIMGNQLRWNESTSTLQFQEFYTNSDKATYEWMNAGYRPGVWQYDINHGTPVKDDIYDYYLVYNPNTMINDGSEDPEPVVAPPLGEVGHTKELSSNYDGTYNLELGVSGKKEQIERNNDINVIIVMDTSSSMNRNYWNEDNASPTENSRLYNTRVALKSFATSLGNFNSPANPDAVEMAFITFNRSASHVKLDNDSGDNAYWTTSSSVFNNAVDTKTATDTGTNWAWALDRVNERMDGHNDGDPTYVLFVTDGAPSQYWHTADTIFYVSGNGCYLGARDEARELVRNDAVLYGVFAFGPQADMDNDYLGALVDYAYDTPGSRNTYRFNVKDPSNLQSRLNSILASIQDKFGFSDVTINDGITELTTVTFEDADPESFIYTIAYKDYTALDKFEEKTVAITVTKDGSADVLSIPSVQYKTVIEGELVDVTTEQVLIKGAEFTSSPTKKVTWQLVKTDGTPYLLENGWKYNVKFKIWPSQPSYDLLAALNNGFLAWGDDYTYTDDEGSHTVEATKYMQQIYQAGSMYYLRTNTDANVTYKQTTEETTSSGTTYTYSDVKTVSLPEVGGMVLDNTEISLCKLWNTTLSSEDYDKINSVDLYILEDPTPEKIAAFNEAYAACAAAETPTPAQVAAFEKTYYFKARLDKASGWKSLVSISPGIYDQEGKKKTTGHVYAVMEPAIDAHYELEATPIHPMLNGLTHANQDDIRDMVDIYSTEINPPTFERGTDGNSVYSVANTLKAGININKELVDVLPSQRDYLNMGEYFTVKVTLRDANDNPVYSPTYGGGEVAYRISAPAEIPSGATVTYDAAPGGDVLSYRINGITYEAEKTDGVITGFVARGPIGADGTVTLKIRECDSLRIVNVPIGTSYTVEEVVDETSDFEFKETHWEVKKGGSVYEDKTATLNTVSTTQTIVPDAENNVVFRNKPKVPTKDLTIMKTGANDAGLPGATFQLLVKNEAGIYGPVLATDGYADILFDGNPLQTITIGKLTKSSTFTTNGTAQVLSALPIGGYKIVELQAPDGYIVSSAEIEFAVTVRGISMITESDLLHFEEETDNASAKLTVNNAPGESLPNTGGPGTGSLYLFGFTLTCVAAAGLVMKRRRRAA